MMCLVEPFAVRHSTDQRDRRIDDEHAEQDHPAPEQPVHHPSGLQREYGQHEPEESAAGITHEDLRRRPIPHQKARVADARTRGAIHKCSPGAATPLRKTALRQTVMASTPAMPSIPSMKFVRLSIQTRYNAAIANPTHPESSTKPIAVSGGTPPSFASTHDAAAKCPTSRQRGATCPRSSTNPISATRAPPPRRLHTLDQASQCDQPIAKRANNVDSAIATPPPRGVAIVCELRRVWHIKK